MSSEEELANALGRISRDAGGLLRRRFGAPGQVAKKGAIDLVTDADKAAEALVVEALSALAPDAAILAEESGARAGRGELSFVVDPLDGTTNFARGIPHYAVNIAATDAQGLVAAATYDPSRDELFLATRGGGATLDGAPMRVNRGVELDDAVLATGFPYDVRTRGEEPFVLFERFVTRARAVRRFGSAALDLAWVAAGRYDGYFERGLKPWDLAAGLLLVREAGGVALDYAGADADATSGEAVAAAPELARTMADVIAGRGRTR